MQQGRNTSVASTVFLTGPSSPTATRPSEDSMTRAAASGSLQTPPCFASSGCLLLQNICLLQLPLMLRSLVHAKQKYLMLLLGILAASVTTRPAWRHQAVCGPTLLAARRSLFTWPSSAETPSTRSLMASKQHCFCLGGLTVPGGGGFERRWYIGEEDACTWAKGEPYFNWRQKEKCEPKSSSVGN